MKRLINSAADHSWLVLLSLAILSLLAATQLANLRIQVSAESMLEKGTPAWDYFVETEETFGAEDMAIIVLRDPAIFEQARLERIRELVRALNNVPQVTHTSSLFNAINLKNIDETIHTRPYLKDLPTTPAQVHPPRRLGPS